MHLPLFKSFTGIPSKGVLFLMMGMLFLPACQLKSDEESARIQLASEEAAEGDVAEPLEASFLSDSQKFSYTLHYDGRLMQIVDGQFEGASVTDASFSVSGGAQIVVKVDTEASLFDLNLGSEGEAALVNEMVEAPQEVNGFMVYRSTGTEGTCAVETVMIPVEEEVLVLSLKICEGQNAGLGKEALFRLIEGLEVGDV